MKLSMFVSLAAIPLFFLASCKNGESEKVCPSGQSVSSASNSKEADHGGTQIADGAEPNEPPSNEPDYAKLVRTIIALVRSSDEDGRVLEGLATDDIDTLLKIEYIKRTEPKFVQHKSIMEVQNEAIRSIQSRQGALYRKYAELATLAVYEPKVEIIEARALSARGYVSSLVEVYARFKYTNPDFSPIFKDGNIYRVKEVIGIFTLDGRYLRSFKRMHGYEERWNLPENRLFACYVHGGPMVFVRFGAWFYDVGEGCRAELDLGGTTVPLHRVQYSGDPPKSEFETKGSSLNEFITSRPVDCKLTIFEGERIQSVYTFAIPPLYRTGEFYRHAFLPEEITQFYGGTWRKATTFDALGVTEDGIIPMKRN